LHSAGFSRARARATAVAFVAAAAAALVTAGVALADGDPASDVLATQSLFLPQDAGVSAARQSELVALLDEARRRGAQLRVAVVASPADLGSVSERWRQPSSYARFLDQELSLVYRAPLLVVMPNGLALYEPGARTPAARSAIAALPAPGSISRLGDSTVTAIETFAAASGHPLTAPGAVGPSAGPSSGADAIAWLVFALGALAIVVAWTLSLRAQPLQATSRSDPEAGHGSTGV
jgi:hypothetical protein